MMFSVHSLIVLLESGFCTDASIAGDSPETEEPRHKRAERSDSLLSSDSLSTNVSPTETPCLKYDPSLEEVIWHTYT